MASQRKDSVVRLSIPCRPGFLRLMRLVVAGYASRWELPFDEVEYIKVAVSEACNNALKCPAAAGCEDIAIQCWHQGGRLGFEISGGNRGALDAGDEPSSGIAPEEEMELGLLLIRSLMEDVEVTSDPEKGTRVVMFKTLGRPDKGKNASAKKVKASS